MSMTDHDKFRALVTQLYAAVNELEAMFPGRHFTPDGHMVGSLGECLVADAYNLEVAVLRVMRAFVLTYVPEGVHLVKS